MQPQDSLAATGVRWTSRTISTFCAGTKPGFSVRVFAALVVSVVVAFLWPDTYVSVAVIRVVPPQVPETLVATNVSGDLQGRINSLAQLILNRATLLNIINTQGLYKKELSRKPSDDVIEDMRAHDIKVVPLALSLQQIGASGPRYPAFEIQFAYNNRFTAQKVVHRPGGAISGGKHPRGLPANRLHHAVPARSVGSAKKKLDGVEQKLSVFRSKNIGRLPGGAAVQLPAVDRHASQMLNLNTAMNRVNQEKLLFENQLRIYREQLSSMKDPVCSKSRYRSRKTTSWPKKIARLRNYEDTLVAARERYKDTHPDVQRLISLIASAKKQRETMAKEEETKKPDSAAPAAPVRPANPQFIREQRDLDAANSADARLDPGQRSRDGRLQEAGQRRRELPSCPIKRASKAFRSGSRNTTN